MYIIYMVSYCIVHIYCSIQYIHIYRCRYDVLIRTSSLLLRGHLPPPALADTRGQEGHAACDVEDVDHHHGQAAGRLKRVLQLNPYQNDY